MLRRKLGRLRGVARRLGRASREVDSLTHNLRRQVASPGAKDRALAVADSLRTAADTLDELGTTPTRYGTPPHTHTESRVST